MIYITKNRYPPRVCFLQPGHTNFGRAKWRVATGKVIAAFNNNPVPFNDGTYSFTAHYGYTEFRTRLEQCQGPKCCFCEKPVNGGQIEHFRPIKGWKQATGTGIVRPGYYWLAYKWENM